MGSPIVRQATPSDLPHADEVSRLATEDLRKIYRPAASVAALPASTVRLVAELDGKIVGTVRYSLEQDGLHIVGLMVHPDYRCQGIALAIINALVEVAREHNIGTLSLYTICQTGNVEVFSKLGFSIAQEQPADWAKGVDGQPLTEAYMTRIV